MNLSPLIGITGITLTIIAGGEPAIISLAFAAAVAKISLITVIIVGYLSVVVGDIFWFVLARELSVKKLKDWKFIKKSYDVYAETISKVEQKKPLRLLFWARSFYSGGWFAIIYLAGTDISLKKMVKYSVIVNAFWVALSVFLGWEAGKGFKYALRLFTDMRIAITILVAMVIIFYLVYYWFKKKK